MMRKREDGENAKKRKEKATPESPQTECVPLGLGDGDWKPEAAFPGDGVHSQNLETCLCQSSKFPHSHVVTDPLHLPASSADTLFAH